VRLHRDGGEALELEKARHQPFTGGYAVPVDPLAGETTVRHLVRFAQRGTYALPPARFYRMYAPDAKAFESGGARRWEVR
jgi:uncharacterized protein YfaS (alpha-2-macroglobulin family)